HVTGVQTCALPILFSADVSVSGMSETSNYYLSAAVTDEKGLIFNDNQKRVTLRSNLESKVANWMTIGMNATFSHRDMSGAEANLRDAYRKIGRASCRERVEMLVVVRC